MPPLRPLAPPRCLISMNCGSSSSSSNSSDGSSSSLNLLRRISTAYTSFRIQTSTPTNAQARPYPYPHPHTPTHTYTYTQTRPLSSTPAAARQTPSYRTVPADAVPAYPYGRFETYKQRNQGLYGRGKIRFGNTVSEKYDRKSRTTWLPNRHTKRLWSPALGAFIRTRLTARVLRTIDRLGGIDEYLLGAKQKRVRELGPAGWALRWKVIQTPAVQARFAREREALGLPPREGTGAGAGDAAAAAAAAAEATAELESATGQGVDAQAMHDMLDGMIARDEEFVLGPEELSKSEIQAEVAEAEAEHEHGKAEAEAEHEHGKTEAESESIPKA